MTEWERSREQEEFVRASILYRPSTSSLSSRFTRASQQEDQDSVEVDRDQEVRGHRPNPDPDPAESRCVCCCQGDVDDKQSAVKMKMFGKLTRETFEWHPERLLSRRFNVPEAYPGYTHTHTVSAVMLSRVLTGGPLCVAMVTGLESWVCRR